MEITVGMSHEASVADFIASKLALSLLTHRTDRQVAERSILIKNLLEDIGDQTVDEAVPIPNVSSQHPQVSRSRS